MFRIGKAVETGRRLVIARDWGGGLGVEGINWE